MGFRFFVDGLCRKCGKPAKYFCDSCQLYFCDDHLVKVKIQDSPKYFVFCEKCYKAKKKPIDPYRESRNPFYRI